jgi:hypothetical protein
MSASCCLHNPGQPCTTTSRLVLDRTLMEAVCGGVGEVAQICVLYPLETIKVRTPQREFARAPVPQSARTQPGAAQWERQGGHSCKPQQAASAIQYVYPVIGRYVIVMK